MSEALRLPSLSPSKIPLIAGGENSHKKESSGYDTPMTKINRIARSWKTISRPGDVYRPGPSDWNRPRPLGLLPERDRYVDPYALYLELMRPPVSTMSDTVIPILKYGTANETPSNTTRSVEVKDDSREPRRDTHGVRSHHITKEQVEGSTQRDEPKVPYRLKRSSISATQPISTSLVEERIQEMEYYQSLVRMAELTIVERGKVRHKTLPPAPPQAPSRPIMTSIGDKPPANTPDPAMMKDHQSRRKGRSFSAPSYFSFVNQASTNHRLLTSDQRCAEDYIPCERCRIKGGRCKNCRAIRTGGGYIILDEEDDGRGRGRGGRDGCHDDDQLWMDGKGGGNGVGSTLDVIREKDEGQNGTGNGNGEDQSGNKDKGIHSRGHDSRGRKDLGRNWDGEGMSKADGQNRSQGDSSGASNSGRIQSGRKQSRLGSSHGNRMGSGRKGFGGDSESDVRGDGSRLSTNSGSDLLTGAGEGDGDWRRGNSERGDGDGESGEGRGQSKQQGLVRKGRRETDGGLDKQKGKVTRSADGDGDDDGRKSKLKTDHKKSKKTKSSLNVEGQDEDDESFDRKKRGMKSLRGEGEEDEETSKQNYNSELRRLRPRKDNVKALSCTLKELKDIDPLDYLAKYCILDPKKMPFYQRVYDNVDRDEDDEINISELDFALKSVNYDLISDPELTYVHSILELAGRWKLNFRLFSLIAALSEKVVALEDMVKKLINGMDFQALEVKMKKCKELFYLLDSMDSTGRGGVVTTDSLAVELQAGGLTQEHVLYVVDRLNYEGRGIVEFLDYLTYVPLFVEIHDHICGNPLDVSRVK